MSDLDERIKRAVATYFETVQNIESLTVEDITKQVFLALSDPEDIVDFNARRTFIELISSPSDGDISLYCRINCLRGWICAPGNCFYKKSEISGATVTSTIYTGEMLKLAYHDDVKKMKANVEDFNEATAPILQNILASGEYSDSEVIDGVFKLRKLWNVPMKDKVELDDHGRISNFTYLWPKRSASDRAILDILTE